ncbi:MAG TPA: periplasmic heavy metal sensor [Vicinamibacterales bacterium]|nr:periplasmic heavy metal sensor [Vicinamibacterales bacterium]
MRYKATMAAVAAAVLVTGMSVAQAGGQMGPGAGGSRMERMQGPRGGGLERLNLTQEQRQQVQQLMQAEREANREKAGQMADLQRQLREAIFRGEGDASAIGQQINELQAQLLQARIGHMQKVAGILTPEQREQMASMPARGPGAMRPGKRGGI